MAIITGNEFVHLDKVILIIILKFLGITKSYFIITGMIISDEFNEITWLPNLTTGVPILKHSKSNELNFLQSWEWGEIKKPSWQPL
jgi:hypothetical protein